MKRQDNWKQDNPRDQAIAVLGSIAGQISNLIDSHTALERLSILGKTLNECVDLERLIRSLPPGQWDLPTKEFDKSKCSNCGGLGLDPAHAPTGCFKCGR